MNNFYMYLYVHFNYKMGEMYIEVWQINYNK